MGATTTGAHPRRVSLTSPALVAAGLVAIAIAAPCGGGDDPDGSEGFERFQEDGVAVEYPSAWTRDEAREGGEAGTLLSVLADSRPFQLNDGRAVSDGRAGVPGADGAWPRRDHGPSSGRSGSSARST
jgi:hypothetical protein